MHAHDRTMLQKLGFADADRKNPEHDWAVQYLAQEERAKRLIEAYAKGGRWNEPFTYWHHQQPEFQLMKGDGKYRTAIGFVDLAISFQQVQTERVRGTDEKRWLRYPEQVKVEGVWFDGDANLDDVSYSADRRQWEERKFGSEPNLVVQPPPARGTHTAIAGGWSGRQLWLGHQRYQSPDPDVRKFWAYLEPEYEYTKGWIRRGCLIVEVKTGQTPIGDTIRQIALYREFEAAFAACFYKNAAMPAQANADEWDMQPSLFRYILATTYNIDTDEARILKQSNIEHVRLGAAFEEYCEERRDNRAVAPSLEI